MDISIIIVNYNSGAFLFNCVNSIITNLSDIDYEILVVDNKSSDDSFDRCKAIMNNRLKLIQSNANLGFSKANNLGADRATGKILHFLNPDTQIDFAMIGDYKRVVNDYNKGKCHVYVNPLHNRDGSICYGRNALPGSLNWIKYYLFRSKVNWYYIGASVIMSKMDFERIGKWNERIFMYYEDADIFYRINHLKIPIIELSNAIFHYGGASSEKSFSNFQREVLIQKGIQVYRSSNNLNWLDYWLWQFMVVLSFCKRPKRMWWQIKAIFFSFTK